MITTTTCNNNPYTFSKSGITSHYHSFIRRQYNIINDMKKYLINKYINYLSIYIFLNQSLNFFIAEDLRLQRNIDNYTIIRRCLSSFSSSKSSTASSTTSPSSSKMGKMDSSDSNLVDRTEFLITRVNIRRSRICSKVIEKKEFLPIRHDLFFQLKQA